MSKKTAKSDWDFDAIEREVERAEVGVDEGGNLIQCVALGSVLNIAPSGKYYMPLTSNQTEEDVEEDSEYFEELEAELGKCGLSLTSGEGDPLDQFACRVIASEGEWEHKKKWKHLRR